MHIEAPKNNGFKEEFIYLQPQKIKPNNNNNNNLHKGKDTTDNCYIKEKHHKNRKRKIIWFNPIFCKLSNINIEKYFFELIDKLLNQYNMLHKIFNKKTLKISCSCTSNFLKSLTYIIRKRNGIPQIAAQDNAIRTNHIKVRIDKTQQDSKCRLCSDRDETINHIISECSKLAQKEYKARHNWVGKVIHKEMCWKFQFDHTNKWYMHNPAPVLENDSHKLLLDFNIMDHLIPARRPDLIIINKKWESAKLLSRRTTE